MIHKPMCGVCSKLNNPPSPPAGRRLQLPGIEVVDLVTLTKPPAPVAAAPAAVASAAAVAPAAVPMLANTHTCKHTHAHAHMRTHARARTHT